MRLEAEIDTVWTLHVAQFSVVCSIESYTKSVSYLIFIYGNERHLVRALIVTDDDGFIAYETRVIDMSILFDGEAIRRYARSVQPPMSASGGINEVKGWSRTFVSDQGSGPRHA